MKTRALLKTLGFQEDWDAVIHPAYYYDFGNLRLEAGEVMSKYLTPCFLFSGVIHDERFLKTINFEMPLEIESFEQGVAWISYGIGGKFLPRLPTLWLEDGRRWRDRLPWVRRMEAYKGRPQCAVDKDWFRVGIKKLRQLAQSATESELVWVAFDGEVLRITGGGVTIIMPATGAAWSTHYAIKATQLCHLPKRLADPVRIDVWDGKISVGRRVWNLARLNM